MIHTDFRIINRFSKETTNSGDVVYLPENRIYLFRHGDDQVGFVMIGSPFTEKMTLGHKHWLEDDVTRIVMVIGQADTVTEAQRVIDTFEQEEARMIKALLNLTRAVTTIDKLKDGSLAMTVTGEYLYKKHNNGTFYTINFDYDEHEISDITVENHTRDWTGEPVMCIYPNGLTDLAKACEAVMSFPRITREAKHSGNATIFKMARIKAEALAQNNA